MTLNKQHDDEWSHKIKADLISAGGKWVKLSANKQQRESIARRLNVVMISNLEAQIHLSPKNKGHVLEISGTLSADVTQECVESLNPLETHVEDKFDAWFADYDQAASFTKAQHERKARYDIEELQMMEEKDDPEPMVAGEVDLADLVVQHLSLAINPYPRLDSGKNETQGDAKVSSGALRPNPFAALKNWRPKD